MGIVATGADSRWLGVPGEYEFRGKGISSCATCDGFLYRGRDVLVVGGGDTAMEDALVLARPKINVVWNTVVEKFTGDADSVTSATLKTKGYDSVEKKIGAAFVAIGHDPNTKMFRGQLDIDDA